MFVVRDWIELDEFGLGLANGKDYIEQESRRVSVNLIVVPRRYFNFIDVGNMKYMLFYLLIFKFNSINCILSNYH